MSNVHEFPGGVRAQAIELLDAIADAESVIIATLERECEALRSGRMLAAKALHTRLCDSVSIYLNAARAAQASIRLIEDLMPGSAKLLADARAAFSSLLKVELAVLAAERAAGGEAGSSELSDDGQWETSAVLPHVDTRRRTGSTVTAAAPEQALLPLPALSVSKRGIR